MKFVVTAVLLSAIASNAALPTDAPRAEKQIDGSVLLNPPAAKAVDDELRRLQGVERQHKAEQWAPVILISVGLGILIGAAVVGVPVAIATASKPGS